MYAGEDNVDDGYHRHHAVDVLTLSTVFKMIDKSHRWLIVTLSAAFNHDVVHQHVRKSNLSNQLPFEHGPRAMHRKGLSRPFNSDEWHKHQWKLC